MLSEGIKLAEHSTWLGLMIAVPTLIAYSILTNRSNQIIDDLSKAGLNLFYSIGI